MYDSEAYQPTHLERLITCFNYSGYTRNRKLLDRASLKILKTPLGIIVLLTDPSSSHIPLSFSCTVMLFLSKQLAAK